MSFQNSLLNSAGRPSLPGLLLYSIDFKLSKHSVFVKGPSHRFSSTSSNISSLPSGKNRSSYT